MKNRRTILNIFGVRSLEELKSSLSSPLALDINSTDSDGRTLLMEATVGRAFDLTRRLIELGADVNLRDDNNWTALHFAAQNYDVQIVDMLIKSGADVNALNSHGNTPLILAVINSKGKGEVIRELVRNGADPDQKNLSGTSANELASRISNFDVSQYLSNTI